MSGVISTAASAAQQYISNVLGPDIQTEEVDCMNVTYAEKFELMEFVTTTFITNIFDLLKRLGASEDSLRSAANSGQRVVLRAVTKLSSEFVEECKVKGKSTTLSSTISSGSRTETSNLSIRSESSRFVWSQSLSYVVTLEAGPSASFPVVSLAAQSPATTPTRSTAPVPNTTNKVEVDITPLTRYAPFTATPFAIPRTAPPADAAIGASPPRRPTPTMNPAVVAIKAAAAVLADVAFPNTLRVALDDFARNACSDAAARSDVPPLGTTVLPMARDAEAIATAIVTGYVIETIPTDARAATRATDAVLGPPTDPSGPLQGSALWSPALWAAARKQSLDAAFASVNTAAGNVSSTSSIDWRALVTVPFVFNVAARYGERYGGAVSHVDSLAVSGLLAAVGAAGVTESNVRAYLRHHNSRRWAAAVAPRPLSFQARCGKTAPEATVDVTRGDGWADNGATCGGGLRRYHGGIIGAPPAAVSADDVALHAFGRVGALVTSGAAAGGGKAPTTLAVALGPTTSVPLSGTLGVHTVVDVDFGRSGGGATTNIEDAYRITVATKPFSGAVLMVGTVADGVITPTAAVVVRGGTSVTIPLALKVVPSAKAFRAAVAQLSPNAAAFAAAVRAHQLAASTFALVAVPLRPLLERAVRLPAGALARDVVVSSKAFDLLSTESVPAGAIAPISAGDAAAASAEHSAADVAPEDVRATDPLTAAITVGDAVEELRKRVARVQRVLESGAQQLLLSAALTAASNKIDKGGRSGAAERRNARLRAARRRGLGPDGGGAWLPKLSESDDDTPASSVESSTTSDDDEVPAVHTMMASAQPMMARNVMYSKRSMVYDDADMDLSAMLCADAPMMEAAPPPPSVMSAPPPPPPPPPGGEMNAEEEGEAPDAARTPSDDVDPSTRPRVDPAPQPAAPASPTDSATTPPPAEDGKAPPLPPLCVDIDALPTRLEAALDACDADGIVSNAILTASTTWNVSVKRSITAQPTKEVWESDRVADETKDALRILDVMTNAGALAAAHASVHIITVGVVSFPHALMRTVAVENDSVVERLDDVSKAVVGVLTDRPAGESLTQWSPPYVVE